MKYCGGLQVAITKFVLYLNDVQLGSATNGMLKSIGDGVVLVFKVVTFSTVTFHFFSILHALHLRRRRTSYIVPRGLLLYH